MARNSFKNASANFFSLEKGIVLEENKEFLLIEGDDSKLNFKRISTEQGKCNLFLIYY